MRNLILGLAVVAITAFPAAAADPARPTVIELFQSQGCSDCPPANANLNAIADRPDLLPLSFSVTYWDHLGWKDTFAKPAFTARQWDYAKAGDRGQVFTPQMIVNGRGVLVGSNRAEVDAAIRKFDRGSGGPSIRRDGNKVVIGAGKVDEPAIVWLVQYDPRVQEVPVGAGENGGKTLPHRDIVRSLIQLGTWQGPPAEFGLRAIQNPAYKIAILVQDGKGGPITAAARLSGS